MSVTIQAVEATFPIEDVYQVYRGKGRRGRHSSSPKAVKMAVTQLLKESYIIDFDLKVAYVEGLGVDNDRSICVWFI
jgi:hypothetical protein